MQSRSRPTYRHLRNVLVMTFVFVTVHFSFLWMSGFRRTTQTGPVGHKESTRVMGDHHYMSERVKRISQVCQDFSEDLLIQYANMFNQEASWSALAEPLWTNTDVLVNRGSRLVWCKVPKVASTSMVDALLRVLGRGAQTGKQGIKDISLRHISLRRLMPYPQPGENFGGFNAFLVVRHPFQRILSAYRDKLMDRGAKYRFKLFKTRYGREIIEKYRVQEQPVAYSDLPTFWEFVEYLLHTPPWEYNEHWRPYYLVCSPCHHHYNIIMHLETLEEDVKYLVNVTGFPELAPGQTHKTKINLVPARDGEEEPEEEKLDSVSDSRTSLEASFYRDVSMEQLTRLYEVYKIDFEMFGYDISPYDKYVRR